MTTLRLLLAGLLAAALAAVIAQRNTMSRARAENQMLLRESAEARQLAQENEAIERLRVEQEEAARLRDANKDLLKLRNEVRQLRQQREDLAGLRVENQRLLSAPPTAVVTDSAVSVPQNFLPKERLVDAGHATPEAAAQTFLWAMREGNYRRAIESWSPRMQNKQRLPKMSPDQLALAEETFRQEMDLTMAHFPGYSVVDRKEISPDEVVIGVQSSMQGAVARMHLKRIDGTWKVDRGPE